MKSLVKLFAVMMLCAMISPFAVSAEEVSYADAAKALTYEIISDEVNFAITKDINLSAVAGKIGVPVTWESSDESVITDEGVITRDNYRNGKATLTATIGTGANAVTKKFDFTVLADAINTYYSDTFYYPGYEGKLITDASSKWKFTRKTTLDGDGMITKIVKEDTPEVNYYSRGGRTGYTEAVHYTQLPFGDDYNGQLTWEADIMFDNDEGTRQLYFIEFYGKYQVGQYVETAQIADFRIDFGADGRVYAYTRYIDGTTTKSKNVPGSYTKAIKEETWARLRIDMDTETQTWDIYIDDEPFILDTPFFEKGRANIKRDEFIGATYMQYGPFRTYTSGNAICFDNMSFRDNNRHYDENADAYELADKIDFSLLTDENADSVTENLDLSLSSLQSYINSKDITVTWESSNEDALSISGNKAILNRGMTPQHLTLTANIDQAGKTYTVKKSFDITVMPADDYIKVYNVYRNLTEETFTTEPADSISKDLDFSDSHISKYADLDGVSLEFTTTDEDVISSTGVVARGEGDKPCEVTVTITDDATGASMVKSFNYTVLDKKQYVYHSTNFAYPEQLGKDIPTISGWSLNGSSTNPNRFKSTVEKDGDNYLLQSVRGEADASATNLNVFSFSSAKSNVSIKMDVKFEHDKTPGMYVFYIYGRYMKGNTSTSMQCGEIRFDYDTSMAYIPYYKGTKVTTETVLTLPRIGEWMELEFRMDVLSQTYDIFINGQQYNLHSIPFYNALNENAGSEEMRNCIGIYGMHYNTYRYRANNAIYTDNVVVTGERGLQSNCEIYENGEKLKELKFVNGFEDYEYDLVTRMVNDTDSQKDFDLYVAIYDNGKLVSARKKAGISMPAGSFATETFEDIDLPKDLENVEIKVFEIDQNFAPIAVNTHILSEILTDYEPEEYYFEDTGRTMTYIDLHGKIAYKPYFNAQVWSADSRKLYFQGKDHSIYEYNSDEDTIRFIAEGRGNYGMVTTPQNKLIYSAKNGDIIEMDCDTYAKRVAGKLPEGQTTGGSQLTVSNDGKYLCLIWSTDDLGGMENSDTLKNRRFPVLDMETGVWNLDNYFGFADATPYNTGMNPAYPNLILFNHVAAEGDTLDRNWVIDTNTGIATNRFKQKDYTSTLTGEVISHETWSYDGELLYIDKARSSKIAMGGVMSFDKDGNNRRHINDDYSYLHLGVSPANPRFVVSDTGYGAHKTSDIVVVDCHSGKSYKLATTNQTGDDSVAHSHPAFSPDGQKVYFGVYNGDYTSAGIGVIDVSDIVNQPDLMEIVDLSASCNAESYPGMKHEIKRVEKAGETGYNIENGNFMRVNYKGAEESNVEAGVEITYFADGGQGELGYFVWVEDPETHNSLDSLTYTFDKLNTGKWETVTILFDDINLENMGHMGSDFYLKGIDSDLIVKSVSLGKVVAFEEIANNQLIDYITEDLDLGENTLTSSNPSVITADGKVNRPLTEDAVVVIKVNGVSEYTLTVKAQTTDVLYQDNFHYTDKIGEYINTVPGWTTYMQEDRIYGKIQSENGDCYLETRLDNVSTYEYSVQYANSKANNKNKVCVELSMKYLKDAEKTQNYFDIYSDTKKRIARVTITNTTLSSNSIRTNRAALGGENRIKLVFDFENNTYDFYVDGVKVNTTPIAMSDDGDHTNISTLNFISPRTAAYVGSVTGIDDLVMYAYN